MKIVSEAYKKGMQGLLRDRSYCRVTFGNTDISARTDGAWSSNAASYSSYAYIDSIHNYKKAVRDCELNRWRLDGNFVLAGQTDDGWFSDAMSDGDGAISATLTKTFTNVHTFPGLTFDWGDYGHPMCIGVEYYDNNTLVDSYLVAVDSKTTICKKPASEIDKAVITFYGTLPHQRARLHYIDWGISETYGNDRLLSVSQKHSVDPLSRKLPDEEVSFTITDYEHQYDPDNIQGVFAYTNKGSAIKLEYGYRISRDEIEWIKGDDYSLSDMPEFKNNQVTFKGVGLLQSLTDNYYKSAVGSKTLYAMAEGVLLDANLPLTPDGEHPWVIDSALQNMYSSGVLPIDSHKNCLQLIAHAARCRLYTDDDNIIHLKPFGVNLKGIYHGVFSDNGHAYWSSWDGVDAGIEVEYPYATCELNFWRLNGGYDIIPDSITPAPDPSPVETWVTFINGQLTIFRAWSAVQSDDVLFVG